MKTIYIGIALILLSINTVNAQEFKENVQSLSSKSQKGYMYDVSKEEYMGRFTMPCSGYSRDELIVNFNNSQFAINRIH